MFGYLFYLQSSRLLAKVADSNSAYSIWLRVIPLEFFSIILILIPFISVFYQLQPEKDQAKQPAVMEMKGMEMKGMEMNMEETKPMIKPRVINLIVPLVSVIMLSVFFLLSSRHL